jgi:hypothetical protein
VVKKPGCGECEATFTGGYWSVDPKKDCDGDDAANCYCETPPIGRSSARFPCKNPKVIGNEASATLIYFGFDCDASGNEPTKRIFFEVPDSTLVTKFNFKQDGWTVKGIEDDNPALYDPDDPQPQLQPIAQIVSPVHHLKFRHQDNPAGEVIQFNAMRPSIELVFRNWKIKIVRD